MTKKLSKVTQKDMDAFYEAVKGTKPLVQRKTRLASPRNQSDKRQTSSRFQESFDFNETSDLPPVQSEEFIAYKQNDISNKILRKLCKGQYNVDAIIDLHGLSVDEASVTVERFLQASLSEGLRVVLIIHGKGHHSQMPVLKNKLNLWLRKIDAVLAFCSAMPKHGSRGAMYVLLKHNKEEDLDWIKKTL